jgi:hypothetical protein
MRDHLVHPGHPRHMKSACRGFARTTPATQITLFGRSTDSQPNDQLAAHIGGSASAGCITDVDRSAGSARLVAGAQLARR